ncbi:hypothetical protein ABPG72_009064 [Tetrahymena utriculariae]
MKCSLQEAPVCGVSIHYNGQAKANFVNHCIACSIGKVAFTVDGKCEEYTGEAKFCHPALSSSQCSKEYAPSCGYFNKNVYCLVPPCNVDSVNACQACTTENVIYTIKGKCAKN